MADLRYFLYARKSTDVEDKQVRSIDAQLSELRELASRLGLSVVNEFIEKESAKTPAARHTFNAMLDRIDAGEANAILAWHPDRLARNPVDGSRVLNLLDTGRLFHLQFHASSVENTPQGKVMLTIEFGFSKYYIDALSENTKRGLRDKVRRGEYPHLAPIGYLNDRRVKRIMVDRELAPIVREAFERYAGGDETLQTIREFMATRGVLTSSGKLLARRHVSKMLSNPIYYGHFRWGGEIHEGNHAPLISKQLFDEVQQVFAKRWRYSPAEKKLPAKPFLGLLRCAECGGAITAEVQKGHTYYRCTKKLRPRECRQPYIREETLNEQISSILAPFQIRPDWADELLALIETERVQSAQTTSILLSERRAQIEDINLRLHRLTDGLIDGLIDHQTFRERKAKLLAEKKTIEEQMPALTRDHSAWLEPFKNWVITSKTLGEIARGTCLPDKARRAKAIFGSNLLLDQKRARGRAVKPWTVLTEPVRGDTLVSLYHRARTYFQRQFRSS